jgi:hypothetical protein
MERQVDFILARNLEDLEPERGTLDELVITLPNCGHFFTAESLDGHCGLNQYYEREGIDGRWLGLKAPPVGFQKPPTCPTCRTGIDFTTPRYGRVFKCADLGILERNIASQMLHTIGEISTSLAQVDKDAMETRLVEIASKIQLKRKPLPEAQIKIRSKKRQQTLRETRDMPLDWPMLNPGAAQVHGIPPGDVKAWKEATHTLFFAYRRASDIARKRSSHVHAWDASVSFLFRREMDFAANHPERAPRRPAEHAMRVARMQVGQARPLADQRYKVQAIWVTVRVRFILAHLARAWLKAMFDRAGAAEHQRTWADFARFLLQTALQDAQIALKLADDSGSVRQRTESALLVMHGELQLRAFSLYMSLQTGTATDAEARMKLVERNQILRAKAEGYMQATIDHHIAIERAPHLRAAEDEWLDVHFRQPAAKIMNQWDDLDATCRAGTFYQPISDQDYAEVVRAFNFCEPFVDLYSSSAHAIYAAHTGHFYQCPNGHMYVIGEVPWHALFFPHQFVHVVSTSAAVRWSVQTAWSAARPSAATATRSKATAGPTSRRSALPGNRAPNVARGRGHSETGSPNLSKSRDVHPIYGGSSDTNIHAST